MQATGRDPDTVVEAVRFYLQQALFAEGADAYRVLGVERGADIERIRRHHKLLQAWLHPDRNADAWNDVFATRINQAWTALRNDSSRARYDAAPVAPVPPAAAPHGRAPVAMARHWAPTEAPGIRGPARWLALGAFASCLVLLGLLLFQGPQPVPVQRATMVASGPAAEPAAPAEVDVRIASVAASVADRNEMPMDGSFETEIGLPPDLQPDTPIEVPAAEPAARPIARQPEVPAAVSRSLVAPSVVAPSVVAPRRIAQAHPVAPQPPARPRGPPSPGPASTAASRPVATAAPRPSVPVEPPPAPTPAATAAADPFERMQEAEASLRTALAYLSDPGGTPPLWNDPRAAENGARTRQALHARARVRQVDVSASHWVLREGEARFDGAYATGGRAGERGHVALQLVRREGRWLVADLRLEPAG